MFSCSIVLSHTTGPCYTPRAGGSPVRAETPREQGMVHRHCGAHRGRRPVLSMQTEHILCLSRSHSHALFLSLSHSLFLESTSLTTPLLAQVDRLFVQKHPESKAGCTATVVLIVAGVLYIAHVGDCKVLLGTRSDHGKRYRSTGVCRRILGN